MSVRALLIYLCLAAPAFGQGFAGLGTEADGFSVPQLGTAFNFPGDHGPHPGYRIEWWYLTANLQAADGTDYGVQWTLFRSALAPLERSGWSSPQLWMGHAGLTTRTHQFVAERLARGGIGQAGVTAAPFAAWIDNWQMAGRALPEADALSALDLRAAGQAFSYELALDAKGPLVPQGVQGYSVKSEGVYPPRIDQSDESRGAAANDVNMLVCTGGRQRSEAEFRNLYEAAGSG